MKHFDLNIQKVLEHWTVAHGLREIIANAIDESVLSRTAEPIIEKNEAGQWVICDFGRGLQYHHFTQNENMEKIKKPNDVIGKFGVGLKDALATFERRGISLIIQSRHNDITIEKSSKNGFEDVITLHAGIQEPTDPNMSGTTFLFTGLADEDMEEAKRFFFKYSGERVIEDTRFGAILKRKGKKSRIYVNGMCVAEEDNFLFSYNITSSTKKLLQSLNRERTNVGRSAYSDRLKSILLECSSQDFAEFLVGDLDEIQSGSAHDEMQWIDVQIHACKILNANDKVLFLTAYDLAGGSKHISYAVAEGYRVVAIPDNLSEKLPDIKDIKGNSITNLSVYSEAFNESFAFDFIPFNKLKANEKKVFKLKNDVLSWFPKEDGLVKKILISESMRPNDYTGMDALGVWDGAEGRIIIRRSQLASPADFVGTLVHELIHAHTDTDDQTIAFENELTDMLGKIGSLLLQK